MNLTKDAIIPNTLEVVCKSSQENRIAGTYKRDGVLISEIQPDAQSLSQGTKAMKVARPKWKKPAILRTRIRKMFSLCSKLRRKNHRGSFAQVLTLKMMLMEVMHYLHKIFGHLT